MGSAPLTGVCGGMACSSGVRGGGGAPRMIPAMSGICERELIHRGAKFDFERVALRRTPGAEPVWREVVRHPGAVTVLPILGEGEGARVVLIRNERFTVERELWELPAGTLEPGEDPAACAARELEEETGFRPGRVEPLGAFYTTPGMTDELMRAFVATDLERREQRLEADERIRVETLPVAEALGLIDRGELVDAKSLSTVLLALRGGHLPAPGGYR